MAQLNNTTINGDCNITGNLTITTGGGKINPIVDLIYPIGSYFITENITLFPDVNAVANYFGGTWVRVNSLFLRSTSDNSTIGKNGTTAQDGGEATVKLEVKHLPSHSHSIYRAGNGGGNWDGSGLAGSPKNSYAGNINSGSTGNNESHNNLPPYRNVIFYRRTA